VVSVSRNKEFFMMNPSDGWEKNNGFSWEDYRNPHTGEKAKRNSTTGGKGPYYNIYDKNGDYKGQTDSQGNYYPEK
jgi:hypothetical protein